MIIFSYYRAWIGIIPLIVSMQFVWKAQEHKSSEIEALDGAAESSKIFSNLESKYPPRIIFHCNLVDKLLLNISDATELRKCEIAEFT